ncbi:unnamed protein product [Adineta ricciae]|uniref:G-protein coupled receptors family 1 profile domain-containing protein n=1 Tax=Adineta ricciae TaxID=249248 RepID=A0A815AJZ8_ADIRI|nr:unnamed protein product [Adineta ricciae]
MSSASLATLRLVEKEVITFIGSAIFLAGLLGGILNITVFLSLQTFRQSSCAFYLTVMSLLNSCQLFTTVLPRILGAIIGTDGSDTSFFFCKFRLFSIAVGTIFSLNCFCFAIMDQYCATCSWPRLQQLCNLKLARCLVCIFGTIWVLYAIPYWIFYNQVVSATTGTTVCVMTNAVYVQIRAYFNSPVLIGFLPIVTTVTFGLMAYRNLQKMRFYTVPLVRRELDKQLTSIVLIQGLINTFVLSPYAIAFIIALTVNVANNAVLKAHIDFSANITFTLFWVYYACPFYINICVSHRFRRQFIHVFSKIYCKHPKGTQNQVHPQA